MMFNALADVDASHVKGPSPPLVFNRHLQTSSLMTCWIAETKFYKTTMEELVK